MIVFKVKLQIAISVIYVLAWAGSSVAGDIDWHKIKTLQDMAFVEYVQRLDLNGILKLMDKLES